jgi:RNA polymerase sigma-70 factor (ECF subfamily)
MPDAQPDGAASFEQHRSLLFGIAYRMLGAVSDAEDIVQETYIRYANAVAQGTRIESDRAYLAAITTRLALDHLKSAAVRREEYVGLWLPEPLPTDEGFADAPEIESASDSLSTAFMILLEKLKPVERAVFLLHDVFGYPHEQVSEIVGKSVANTRKIASRARDAVRGERRIARTTLRESEQVATRFFSAMRSGDVEGLAAVLGGDVVVVGDGGGKVPQWTRPIVGPANVSRLLAGLGRQVVAAGGVIDMHRFNGGPGAIIRTGDGQVVSAFSLEVADGRVVAVRSVVNPDKLGHLGVVADVRALIQGKHAAP